MICLKLRLVLELELELEPGFSFTHLLPESLPPQQRLFSSHAFTVWAYLALFLLL